MTGGRPVAEKYLKANEERRNVLCLVVTPYKLARVRECHLGAFSSGNPLERIVAISDK